MSCVTAPSGEGGGVDFPRASFSLLSFMCGAARVRLLPLPPPREEPGQDFLRRLPKNSFVWRRKSGGKIAPDYCVTEGVKDISDNEDRKKAQEVARKKNEKLRDQLMTRYGLAFCNRATLLRLSPEQRCTIILPFSSLFFPCSRCLLMDVTCPLRVSGTFFARN